MLSDFQTIVVIATISLAFLVLLVSVLALVLRQRRRRKRQKAAREIKHTDENPVYGMYYSATGEHIDESTSEVVDENYYYG